MKKVKTLSDSVMALFEAFKEGLEPDFSVNIGKTLWPDSLGDVPDLVVGDPQTGKYYFIELKGASPSEELPFAAISGLYKLKKFSMQRENSEVFLATSAQLTPLQEKLLRKVKVHVIKSSRPLTDDRTTREIYDKIAKILVKKKRKQIATQSNQNVAHT